MQLRPDIVQWLRSNLTGSVEESDLESTYAFEHPLNHTRSLAYQARDPHGAGAVVWRVDFFEPNQVRVLESPLGRRVHVARLRAGNGRGPVAINASFFVRPEYRNRRFARAVYASEEQLYRRWGVREIHLTAEHDGRVVWIQRFGFQPVEAQLLARDYAGWAQRHGRSPTPPEHAAEYPAEFLTSRTSLQLFKVLQS